MTQSLNNIELMTTKCQTINKLWIYYPNWRIFTKSGHTNPGSNNLGLIIPPKFESQKSLKLKLARK